jgi:hypothetical protein
MPLSWGSVSYPDGSSYEGEWNHGVPNGRGKLTLENGDTYEGEWKNDQACGYGCLISATKTYIGEWQNDVYSGQGEEKWKDGSHFVGQYA